MQIQCLKEELLKGIQTVQNAISPRSTLPILSNVLIETEGSGLRLSTTDLEVGIRSMVKADVRAPGAITVPAKTLSEFLRTLEDGQEVDVKVDGQQKVEVRCGRDRCTLSGLPKEDYPVLPEFNKERSFSIEAVLLRDLIRKTAFAVSTDETRYVLNGINFIVDKGKITCVATDGRRLAVIFRDGIDKKSSMNVIIPTKAMSELLRMLGADEPGVNTGTDSTVAVAFTENQVTFKYRENIIISRLIEGHFPNFDQVIPKKHEITVELPTHKFLLATQRAAVGILEKGGSVKCILEKGKLTLSASAQGRVDVQAEMDIDFKNDKFEVAFNPAYFIDVLKVVGSDRILLDLTSPLTPAVIRSGDDDNFKYVIMPMKLS
ncbi:MAG TPA: DNA polymerase III subunit beta [Elusimicrobiota bacterium]|nr:DNA polymerase III subunit beta [Elusimicrobiota bacterium]